MKDKKKLFRIALLFLLLAAIGGGWYVWQDGKVTTDNAAIEGTIVTLSPKVQGYVKAVHIKDNQVVKAGDVLVEIDPSDYQIKRDRAAAALAAPRPPRPPRKPPIPPNPPGLPPKGFPRRRFFMPPIYFTISCI